MCASTSSTQTGPTPIRGRGRSAPSCATDANAACWEPTSASWRTKTDRRNGVSLTKRTAAIVGVHNTRQGRRLDGETSRGLALKAICGALDDAGLSLDDVDGISAGAQSTALIYDLRLGPAWQGLGFG